MILKKIACLISVCLLVTPALLSAASSDFTVRTFVGSDTTPPSTPILQSVTPVAPTQIDIVWSASTDDVILSGYRLFRDNVQIATTTLLSYSDTGLTASTTYSYTVDAFDSFGNISSTSLAVATTTLNVPPVATSTPTTTSSSGGGTRTNPTLAGLTVDVTQTSALFTWQTRGQTQYTLTWGRTTSYELGSVSGIAFSQNHQTAITSLEPGTTYYYELRATDARGASTIIATDRFTTQSAVIADTLPNVQGFSARVQDNDVALTWQNVFTNPNYFVRIVRSHLFYPSSIQSGAVVYEGRGQAFTDRNALLERSPQYYTIFVLDATGAVSSGAVARAVRVSDALQTGTTTPSGSGTPSIIPPDMGDDSILKAVDISIVQQSAVSMFDMGIKLKLGQPYVVSVPYSAVPKNLKSIIVSVQNPTNQREVSSYLLKLNKTGGAYEANVPGGEALGTVRIMVEVFDYEQATVRRISTTVSFIDSAEPVPFFPDRLLSYGGYVVTFFGLSLFWFLVLLWWRRRSAP
jgi:hypothetical protein